MGFSFSNASEVFAKVYDPNWYDQLEWVMTNRDKRFKIIWEDILCMVDARHAEWAASMCEIENAPNPFLSMISKKHSFYGQPILVPIKFGGK